ncbi:hypothetical protein RFF55_000455 [Klebsiella pneumoniae]|uniref:hypothetical protein n=1 Tax=unclassified Klebsiella TaxID=2608929 RepID=UPI002180FF28|nr:hypothetical protein [Klebsiella pneumoniae]GKL24514.1 hypothetical protein NUBL21991_29350 [Klebsiella pneumoniae]HCI8243389.1 hypothetical protein [Klebsiella pneumoniae]
MNDITELAQREKFEAWWESEYKHLESSKYTDAVPHIKYGFWTAYQAGGAELVEALEKAQRANAAQDDHINQQQDRIDTLEKRNAELGGQLSRYSMSPGQADQRACESRAARDALGFGKDADDVAPIDLRERIDGMKARIAELESRTVTVENLQESAYRAGLTAGWNLGLANNNDGFNKCLAAHAAGFKVKAE